jgi:hypothetical protein
MCVCDGAARASFTGAFHCPKATEFCRHETITGVKQPEFQSWQVFVVLGIVVGIPMLIFLSCLFPCLRDPMVRRLKAWSVTLPRCGCAACHNRLNVFADVPALFV